MKKLFIDANAFLCYLFRNKGWHEIQKILCNEQNTLYTSYGILNEVKFKLLYTAASGVSNKKYEIIKIIKKNVKLRKIVLKKYLKFFLEISQIITIMPLNTTVEKLSIGFSINHALLPTDASIVSLMKHHEINYLVTQDKDFKGIPGIQIIPV
tara:strand:- start:938 stop:1396 length:459 start_codon:yes stop_codon:yes gene_type:complete